MMVLEGRDQRGLEQGCLELAYTAHVSRLIHWWSEIAHAESIYTMDIGGC